jgi:hypothetical protein
MIIEGWSDQVLSAVNNNRILVAFSLYFPVSFLCLSFLLPGIIFSNKLLTNKLLPP